VNPQRACMPSAVSPPLHLAVQVTQAVMGMVNSERSRRELSTAWPQSPLDESLLGTELRAQRAQNLDRSEESTMSADNVE
jgi:hypothetical protein